MPLLRTFMSPVMSRYPAEGVLAPPVMLQEVRVNKQALYWLDQMLGGGLELPQDLWDSDAGTPSFVLLLSGAPGTGKTTFALELCYNLATHPQPYKRMRWHSLYVSAETPGARILENAVRFGWDQTSFTVLKKTTQPLEWPQCNVLGSEHFQGPGRQNFAGNFLKAYMEGYPTLGPSERCHLYDAMPVGKRLPPDVLVIDSLNLLWPQQPAQAQPPSVSVTPNPTLLPEKRALLDTFYQLVENVGGGQKGLRPKLLVIILDSFSGRAPHNAWEFLVDSAFHFEWTMGPENYHTRSFRISKIKTQAHALGNNHVYKILPGLPAAGAIQSNAAAPARAVGGRIHAIPYLRSGGTFILPSIHWHLSQSIREDPVPAFSRTSNYPTGLPKLDTILGSGGAGGGLPSMHTTALVGRRGGMKSHLAYSFMLNHALGRTSGENEKSVLLVSMREDFDAARNTLSRLVEQQGFAAAATKGETVIDTLLESDPGCRRVSLDRRKRRNGYRYAT